MLKPAPIVLGAALLAIGFGAGYWFRDSQSPSRAEMEDLALLNVLEDIGYVASITNGNTSQFRDLIDINLHENLSRVRYYQGSRNDEQAVASKIRTLNAAARLWDERPSYSPQSQTPASPNAEWVAEWNTMAAENMKLLEWAKYQCANTPSVKCATGTIGK